MSISGDMVVHVMQACDLECDKAKIMLTAALECAKDPNFATRYAIEALEDGLAVTTCAVGGDNAEALNSKMLEYWDVIEFLKRHL